jgi:hypothetical protein
MRFGWLLARNRGSVRFRGTAVRTTVLSALLGVGVFGAGLGPARADVYSWVDDEGVLHLTNVPADGRFRRYSGPDVEGFGGQLPLVVEIEDDRSGTDGERVLYPVDVGRFDGILRRAAQHYRLPFEFLKAVAKVESNFNPRAVSPMDAKGLMQLIDATARMVEVEDPFDPEQNVFGGARYLRMLANRFDGNMALTAAAYNCGPERVERLGRIPNIRETRKYVQRVLQMYRYYLEH